MHINVTRSVPFKVATKARNMSSYHKEAYNRVKKKVKMGRGDVSLALVEVIDVESYTVQTPTSFRGSNKKNPVPVEKCSVHRDPHRTIINSLFLKKPHPIIDLSNEEEDEIQVINPPSKKKTSKFPSSGIEPGESSKPVFLCEICVEPKSPNQSFNIKGCSHSYCTDCMVRYVATRIQENVTSIRCPESNCKGVLEPEFCHLILPREVFDRWCNALCESFLLGSEKFYCPFSDCSAVLLNEEATKVVESECPHCRRMFCAQCKVVWHAGLSCEAFQKLDVNERGREDIMVLQLAKNNEWQRCPKCKYIVEKSEGCLFMKCRCGFSFCYSCGALRGKVDQFYCSNCKRFFEVFAALATRILFRKWGFGVALKPL